MEEKSANKGGGETQATFEDGNAQLSGHHQLLSFALEPWALVICMLAGRLSKVQQNKK